MYIRRRCARPAQGYARLPNWNAEAWWLRIFDGTPKDEKTIDLGFAHRISALYMYALISSIDPASSWARTVRV